MDYAFGLVPFTSAGIGAPHIRERAYWVAHANSQIHDRRGNVRANGRDEYSDGCNPGKLADTNHDRQQSGCWSCGSSKCAKAGVHSGRGLEAFRLANPSSEQHHKRNDSANEWRWAGNPEQNRMGGEHVRPLEVNGFWRDADWLLCRDGKWRPVEPGTFPLVDGAAARLGRVKSGVARMASSNRTGRLRGYGNAINAQAAAAFISAYMESANVQANPARTDIR